MKPAGKLERLRLETSRMGGVAADCIKVRASRAERRRSSAINLYGKSHLYLNCSKQF